MNIEVLLKRYERAKQRRDIWLQDWEDCYQYAFPTRDSFYTSTPGGTRTEDIYDDTAVGAVHDFGAMMVEGSLSGDFVKLEPGPNVPDTERQKFREELREINAEVLGVMRNSNFEEQAHEGALDLTIGTGNMLVLSSNDAYVANYMSVPLHEVTLDRGPHGDIDGVYRSRVMEIDHIKVVWPKANIPEQLKNRNPEQKDKTSVLECCYRDWSKKELTYIYRIVSPEARAVMWETKYTGMGSKPWVNYRWSKASGEIYGRGPLLNCLNSVRATNLVMSMTFENADIGIGGVWTMEHDGVVNPDTIEIESGTIIPHMPGSKGLRGVTSPSNFDLSNIIVEEQRRNIRRSLYVEDYEGKGKTPISKEEIDARRSMLARRIGAPFNRYFREFIAPAYVATVHIMKKEGLIEMPQINGRDIQVVPRSPFARAADEEMASRKFMYVQGVQSLVGPEQTQVYVKIEDVIEDMTELMDQPKTYLRNEAEREKLVGDAAQVMSQAEGPPQAPQ